MCYLVAKKYITPGCIAYKTVRGKHLAKVVRELGQKVLDRDIQILTVTDLDTYAEYLPAKIVESEEEFIEEVMKIYRCGNEDMA